MNEFHHHSNISTTRKRKRYCITTATDADDQLCHYHPDYITHRMASSCSSLLLIIRWYHQYHRRSRRRIAHCNISNNSICDDDDCRYSFQMRKSHTPKLLILLSLFALWLLQYNYNDCLLVNYFEMLPFILVVEGWHHHPSNVVVPYYHHHRQYPYYRLVVETTTRSNTPTRPFDRTFTQQQQQQQQRIHQRYAHRLHLSIQHFDEDHENDGEMSSSNTTTIVISSVATNDNTTIIQKEIPSLNSAIDNNYNVSSTITSASTSSITLLSSTSVMDIPFLQRVMQLEQLVSAQQVQIRQLTNQVQELIQTTERLTNILAVVVRDASSDTSNNSNNNNSEDADEDVSTKASDPNTGNIPTGTTTKKVTGTSDDSIVVDLTQSIFGTAPATVMDAADAAGAAILAGILGGKQRMLVDVRDAELSFRPEHSETLVQFIELAILPVAAGLEGLRSRRNRLKVVFPTVSHLLTYRKSMALSAPDVVALSTLGFDPVEQKDNLVVILVPSPDDDEGLLAINELLSNQSIIQPVVVINHHMVPVTGPASTFEVAYHLRLLSVQYVSSDNMANDEYFRNLTDRSVLNMIQGSTNNMEAIHYDDNGENDDDTLTIQDSNTMESSMSIEGTNISSTSASLLMDNVDESTTSFLEYDTATAIPTEPDTRTTPAKDMQGIHSDSELTEGNDTAVSMDQIEQQRHDDEVEAAMKHAHLVGMHHGSTRAMVIRAYPRAWHVFVDTSPDTDADYEVAAIFADEPSIDQVNNAIVECIEGSELEDELVAQQMQQAFESGQLDRVSELLASMGLDDLDDDDDDDDPYMKMFGEDTV